MRRRIKYPNFKQKRTRYRYWVKLQNSYIENQSFQLRQQWIIEKRLIGPIVKFDACEWHPFEIRHCSPDFWANISVTQLDERPLRSRIPSPYWAFVAWKPTTPTRIRESFVGVCTLREHFEHVYIIYVRKYTQNRVERSRPRGCHTVSSVSSVLFTRFCCKGNRYTPHTTGRWWSSCFLGYPLSEMGMESGVMKKKGKRE